MERNHRVKVICDVAVMILALGFLFAVWNLGSSTAVNRVLMGGAVICAAAAALDILFLYAGKRRKPEEKAWESEDSKVCALLLLNEEGRPVKSFPIAGKTAVVIGRNNEEEAVDIDLEDCEYGTFINPVHAALNYCLDSWYLEDMGSSNGVRVQKADDGIIYKISSRPCRVSAGDIILIARTRLLMT